MADSGINKYGIEVKTNTSITSAQRNVSLDITRIVAILAVVMIHTSESFVVSYESSSLEFIWGNIFDGISRMGVPLFVMTSGSLILDENRSIGLKNLFFKYIKNTVFLLAFWSIFYCGIYNIIFPFIKGEAISLKRILYSLVMGHFHMWYLYMIIGLYLITPFLREFVRKDNKHLVLLFIVVSLITQFTIPMLNGLSLIREETVYLIEFIEKFHLEFFGGFITYYLIGWYVIHGGIKKQWWIYSLGIISLLIFILYVQITKDYDNGYSNKNILVLAYSTAVFLTLNCKIKQPAKERLRKALETLSKLSFGVYIIHPLLLHVVTWLFAYTGKPFLYILFSFVIVTTLSFVGCYAASKLSIIKKIIRM